MRNVVHKFILAAVFLLAASSLHAQSHYYGLSGDTIRERIPIYMYHWDWHGHVNPISEGSDSPDSLLYRSSNFCGMFMGFNADTAVRVVGVAMCLKVANYHSYYPREEVFEPGSPQYMRLYSVVNDSLIERTSVCWTEDYATHPRRQMEVVWGGQVDFSGRCNNSVVITEYVPILEYYFDSAITVIDSFYIGSTNYDVYPYPLPDLPTGGPNLNDTTDMEVFNEEWERWMKIWNDYCDQLNEIQLWREHHMHFIFELLEPGDDVAACRVHMPPAHVMMYNPLFDSALVRGVSDRMPLIFPIIEIDTVGMPYDTARLDCFVPDSLALQHRFRNGASLVWSTGRFNTSAQLSIIAHDGDPGDGRLVDASAQTYCAITGLDPDSTYDIYLRGWCDLSQRYSPWVGPLVLSPFNDIDRPDEGAVFTLAPNPARGSVTLTVQEPLSLPATVTILDLQGRELRREAMHAQTHTVSLKGLPAATYILRLHTPQGSSSRKLTVDGNERAGRK